jgi:hypothetical protein
MQMTPLDTSILNNFPDIKLFYNLVYKKVYNYDLILALPKGDECFIWFTIHDNKPICVIIYLIIDNDINNTNTNNLINYSFSQYIYDANIEFNNKLIGTIFYGTSIMINDMHYFFIKDLFYYKNINDEFISNHQKLSYKFNEINYILNNYISFSKKSIIFGVPLIHNNYSKLVNLIKNVPYEIKDLAYVSSSSMVCLKYMYKNYSENNIFKVVSTETTDIYNLHTFDNHSNTYIFHSVAFIPNYKTSIMMNQIFNGLKKHDNLDYLEDSDDENDNNENNDSENNNDENKENKLILMKCAYNYKFEKWTPVKVMNNLIHDK